MSVYQFETNIPEEEFDAFVKKSRYCNLLQSYHWANVKENWDHLYTGIYDENRKLVATGLVLIKHLPAKFTMFYLPRRARKNRGKVQRFKQRFSYDRTTSLSYDLS